MKKFHNDLKGLVIGCGSIGERHLHNLKKIGINNLAIFDENKRRVNELGLKYRSEKFYDLKSALSYKPDFSIICTYPDSHLRIANYCIDICSNIFVEKPLSSNLNGVEKMLKRAHSKNLKVAVGYNMRFDHGLRFLKNKLDKGVISTPLSILAESGHNIKFWRPGTDYKYHYILRKGGGIILDGSHEYDYIRWLLNDEVKSVFCQTRKMASIKTETESIASIILKFRKGTVVSLFIDYVRPLYERQCHVIGEKGDLKWKFATKRSSWKDYDSLSDSTVRINLIGRESGVNNFLIPTNQMYLDEMTSFIQSIIEHKKLIVDGWEGLKTLKIGIAALQSARTNKVVSL